MKRKNRIFIFTFTLFILLIFNCFSFFNSYIYADSFDNLELYCNSDIAMDFESGNVLYSHNGTNKIYPASTTKILTCILAIENLKLTDTTIVSNNVVLSTPIGSSIMGVKAGELYTIEELLYGLMLPSGNDAALVVAEAVSGSTEKFVELMNEKVKSLGCKNTHFVNPHGFHDDNHYSTAYDMSIIFKYCLNNETFKKIIETTEIEVKAANSDNTLKLVNSNRLQNKNYPDIYYEYIKGGKTGYTIEARGTFIGYSVKDSKTVIVGTFDGSQNINGRQARYLDATKLFDYSFSNYSRQSIISSNEYTFKIYDKKNKKCYVIKPEKDIYGLVKEIPNINYTLNIDYDKLDEINSMRNADAEDNKTANIIGDITFNYDTKNLDKNFYNNENSKCNLILVGYSNYYIQVGITELFPFGIIILLVILILLIVIYLKIKKENSNLYF